MTQPLSIMATAVNQLPRLADERPPRPAHDPPGPRLRRARGVSQPVSSRKAAPAAYPGPRRTPAPLTVLSTVPELKDPDRLIDDLVADLVVAHDDAPDFAAFELVEPKANSREILQTVRRSRERMPRGCCGPWALVDEEVVEALEIE